MIKRFIKFQVRTIKKIKFITIRKIPIVFLHNAIYRDSDLLDRELTGELRFNVYYLIM